MLAQYTNETVLRYSGHQRVHIICACRCSVQKVRVDLGNSKGFPRSTSLFVIFKLLFTYPFIYLAL